MPFGLCNAPATFERLMEKILHGLLFKSCFVYPDDVIIYGKTWEHMLGNLKGVFQRIRAANLKINPKKCEFFRRKVKYLGHVVSAQRNCHGPGRFQQLPFGHCRKRKNKLDVS